MEKIKIKIEIEKDNPVVLYSFENNGEIIRWTEMDENQKRRVINAFANGYELFSRSVGVCENELQLRESAWQKE